MFTKRIIPCLDVKNGRVVKGKNFEGIRDVSDPVEMARFYNEEGADELGIDITANAGAYGSHYAIMDQYNVIVLAPQVRTYYNEMKADNDRLGITLLSPKGKQYIDLTKDPKGAVAWIEENLEA